MVTKQQEILNQQLKSYGVKNHKQLELVQKAISDGLDFNKEPFTPFEYAWSQLLYPPKRQMYRIKYNRKETSVEEVKAFQPDLDDIRAYFVRKRRGEVKEAGPMSGPKPPNAASDKSRRAILDRYLERFEPQTPNDWANLQLLVNAQQQRASLSALIGQYIDNPMRAPSADDQAKLMMMLDKLHGQCMTLEKALGIDRLTRDKKVTDEDDPEKWKRIAQGARAFMESKITRMKHCGVDIGWTMPTFPEMGWTIITTCPRCGKELIEQISKPEQKKIAQITEHPMDGDGEGAGYSPDLDDGGGAERPPTFGKRHARARSRTPRV